MSPAANSSSSTRWCPTSEQLMMLEEMYRAGIRTPNATQIQHITSQLSFYGKIEGKNVFYWFQNHKARDRQKLRRRLCKQLQQQQLLYHQHHNNYHNYNNYNNYPYSQHSLLECLDQNPTCHYNNYSSASFLPPQVVGVEDTTVNCTAWKMEIPAERVEMEKYMMSMYGRDWMMMMMDVGPPSSPCCTTPTTTTTTTTRPGRAPIKTLQLFPITPSN